MIVDIALPVSLALIMYALGLGLCIGDFTRILTLPKAVAIGVLGQMALIPLIAFLLLQLFDLPPAMGFGVMLISFCPGGPPSNILTKLAGGTVALSITLTAVVSFLSVISIPLLLGLTGSHFLGDTLPKVNVTGIAMSLFAITTAPLLVGMATRHFAPGFADRMDRGLTLTAAGLFVVLVFGAIIENKAVLLANFGQLGPLIIVMIIVLLALGVLLGQFLRLPGPDGVCLSIEMGVQNAALGIAVSGMIAGQGGIPEIGVPAAVYGVLMYVVTLPALVLLKHLAKA